MGIEFRNYIEVFWNLFCKAKLTFLILAILSFWGGYAVNEWHHKERISVLETKLSTKDKAPPNTSERNIPPNTSEPNIPLQSIRTYTFEEMSNPRPWFSVPKEKLHHLGVTTDHAQSGTRSLCLEVDVKKNDGPLSIEYGGVANRDPNLVKDLSEAKAVVAWVRIPDSDQTRNNILEARLLIHLRDQNDVAIGLRSGGKQLKPGEWNSLFVGTFKETDLLDPQLILNEKVEAIYVTVLSSKNPYKGPIYIDEITIYKKKEIGIKK